MPYDLNSRMLVGFFSTKSLFSYKKARMPKKINCKCSISMFFSRVTAFCDVDEQVALGFALSTGGAHIFKGIFKGGTFCFFSNVLLSKLVVMLVHTIQCLCLKRF